MNLETLIDRVVAVVEFAAAMALAAVTALTFVSVIMRYFFAFPVPDDFDFTRLVLGIAIFWGIACACWRGGHIQADLLWNVLPRVGRHGIDIFATLISFGFMVFFAWTVFGRVGGTQASGQTTMVLQVPIWPFYALAAVGLAFAVVLLPAYIYRVLTRRNEG
jgi:TRAP-type C4-dicarboxylate transport system permease small subunit